MHEFSSWDSHGESSQDLNDGGHFKKFLYSLTDFHPKNKPAVNFVISFKQSCNKADHGQIL